MGRRVACLCAGLCVLIPVGWGAVAGVAVSRADSWTAPASSPWPASPGVLEDLLPEPWWVTAGATGLRPTGIELVNAHGVDSMVVDGTGAVWVDGAWQLARVDPASGSAQIWDVADDATFAAIRAIRPSRRAGVWLIEDHSVRLFDGRRFLRDLRVPAALRGGEFGTVTDLAEVGTEVWVSSDAGVARCTQGGAWSWVGEGSISGARMLAVDSLGRVWSVGRVASEGPSPHVLLRFSAGRWSPPGGTGAPRLAEDIVADPMGVLVTRLGLSVRRFDGVRWRRLPLIPSIPGSAHLLSVGPDGALWVAGSQGLSRYTAHEDWRVIAGPEAVASVSGIGFVGTDVVFADESGLLRLDGNGLSRIWASRDPGIGAPMEGLLVTSSDEAWAVDEWGIEQFRDGVWRRRQRGLGWQGGAWFGWSSGMQLALATDSAVWAITDGGLARFEGDERVLVPRDTGDGWLLTGPDAAVWAVGALLAGSFGWYTGQDPDEGGVSLVGADGTLASLSLPGPWWSLKSVAAGADGSVWMTVCEGDRADYCTVPSLMRWDGQWSPVPHPGAGISGISVATDGGLWALLTASVLADEVPVVARYANGTWTQFPDAGNLQWLAPAPGGRACGVDATASALVCIDPTGRVSRLPLAVPGHVHVGPDGSLWLEDAGVVARLPGTMPR
jgi:hypothetical protein